MGLVPNPQALCYIYIVHYRATYYVVAGLALT